jgi:hypothetical protein
MNFNDCPLTDKIVRSLTMKKIHQSRTQKQAPSQLQSRNLALLMNGFLLKPRLLLK